MLLRAIAYLRVLPLATLVSLSACTATQGQVVAPPEEIDAGSSPEDASTPHAETAPGLDAAREVAPQDSGCPAPARITPDNLPNNILPAVSVNLVYPVDGDTMHVRYPEGEKIIRFLYVNTEESHGNET